MWSKTIFLVLVIFLASAIGLPALAGESPNYYDPSGIDPWGGDNQSDDGGDGVTPGDGISVGTISPTSVFITITIENIWLSISSDTKRSSYEETESKYIESSLETTVIKRIPLNAKKGTRIR